MSQSHRRQQAGLEPLLTVGDVAELLRCSKRHVRHLVAAGMLRAVKLASPNTQRVTRQSRLLIVAQSVADYLGARWQPRKNNRIRRALSAGARMGFGPPADSEGTRT